MLNESLLRQATSIVSKKRIEDDIEILKNKYKYIYIYGAGSFGKEMFILLKKYGVCAKLFFDENAHQINDIMGVKVYKLEDNINICKDNVLILFSIVADKDIRKNIINNIKMHGYENIIEAQSLRCLLVKFDKPNDIEIVNYIKTHQEKIYSVVDFWDDEKSKDIYICNVYAHLTKDYSKCNLFENGMDEQYFPKDINMHKGYNHFVDCGGYIGDTVWYLAKNYDVESIVSFEPNIKNFEKLSHVCDCVDSSKNIRITLFPCAVSENICMTMFDGDGGSGSISSSGDNIVQSVALDKVLKNHNITFIKMDIEGEELNSLYGAKNIIENQKPDLAISVYHCINHLWDIPLYLKAINPTYKFYLRSYNAYTMETVLYATCCDKESV